MAGPNIGKYALAFIENSNLTGQQFMAVRNDWEHIQAPVIAERVKEFSGARASADLRVDLFAQDNASVPAAGAKNYKGMASDISPADRPSTSVTFDFLRVASNDDLRGRNLEQQGAGAGSKKKFAPVKTTANSLILF